MCPIWPWGKKKKLLETFRSRVASYGMSNYFLKASV